MNTQVITVRPDGTMSGLQRKTGRGVDLRKFGHAEIERVSEIVWKELHQRWAINFLRTPAMWRGMCTAQVFESANITIPDTAERVNVSVLSDVPRELLLFEDYDDAVATEVAFLDALRLKGTF